jgi:type IV secretory pathway VirB4 component
MKKTIIIERLESLSIQELLQISDEMKEITVPENAAIRKLIKDSEYESSSPLLSFVAVGQLLQFEFATRIRTMMEDKPKIKLKNYGEN